MWPAVSSCYTGPRTFLLAKNEFKLALTISLEWPWGFVCPLLSHRLSSAHLYSMNRHYILLSWCIEVYVKITMKTTNQLQRHYKLYRNSPHPLGYLSARFKPASPAWASWPNISKCLWVSLYIGLFYRQTVRSSCFTKLLLIYLSSDTARSSDSIGNGCKHKCFIKSEKGTF